jgi:hypothetical protein
MREQRAIHVPPRASRTAGYPANPHRAGHFAGLHPEDQPYITSEEDDDSYYPQRMPTSTRRYVDTRGNPVIQQGNRRIVIHNEPPPKKKSHWLLLIGIGMVFMLLLWVGLQMLANWWINHQMDSTYGMPRTYQADQVVGHGDSTDHPSHFIFENLKGHIIIIELPGGDISHARIYSGPTLFSDNAELIPVTAEFKDIHGDGKIDIVLHIQDQRIVFLNDGTQFKPQQ